MSEEQTTDNTATPLTDEQIAEQFPGQDVAHIRSMMGKMNGTSTEDTSTEEGEVVEYPDYIPEKFRQGTVEEATRKMAESYANLEKTVSGKPDAAAATSTESSDSTQDDGEATGVSISTATDEYLANDGVISQATYDALAANGMGKEMVDNYIAGQQAIAGQLVTKVHAAAGGEEAYSSLMQWAGANWSEAEVSAYDKVMEMGDEGAIKLAVAGLKAAYDAAATQDPSLVRGDSGNSNTGPGYQSRAEMTEDMKNPLYKKDPAFRKKVEQKIANSKIW